MCDTPLDVQNVVCVLQWVVPQGSQSAPAAVMEVQSRADARAGGSSGGIFCSSLVYLYSIPVLLRWCIRIQLFYLYCAPTGLPSPVVRPNGLCARWWGFETQRLRECFLDFLGFNRYSHRRGECADALAPVSCPPFEVIEKPNDVYEGVRHTSPTHLATRLETRLSSIHSMRCVCSEV
jgi:hypothetical protein